jgi:type I restriction enzyme S subunit
MKGWKKSELGDIAAINYGYTAKASFEEVGPKFLRITDIQNDSVDWSSVPLCPIDEADFKKHRLYDQDIVFARTGATTGKSYLVCDPPESVAASYLIRLRVEDSGVLARFVSKYFQTREYWDSVTSGISGSAQGGFNASKLSAMVIPIPPIAEQKQIVAILDEAFEGIDSAIANTERNIANARELFESYLNAIFTRKGDDWEETKLGKLLKILTDYHANGSYKILKQNVELLDTEGYAHMVRSTDFEHGFQNAFKYIDQHAYEFLAKSKIFGGEVIISKIGNAGKVYLMPELEMPSSLAMNLFLLRTDQDQLRSDYLYFFLESTLGRVQISERLNGTTTKTIRKDGIRSISVRFPAIEEQEKIVEKLTYVLDETKRLEAVYQQKLAALNELKQSILQKAFSGELTAEVGDAAGLGAKEVVAA